MQTAEVIGRTFNATATPLPGLRELSYGEAEGRSQEWLDERYILPPRHGDRMTHDHGVIGSETRAAFASRVYEAVEAICERPSSRQIIVTHGFALTMVVACWIRMPVTSVGYMAVRSTSGGITELVEDDRFHSRQIVRLNDTRHID